MLRQYLEAGLVSLLTVALLLLFAQVFAYAGPAVLLPTGLLYLTSKRVGLGAGLVAGSLVLMGLGYGPVAQQILLAVGLLLGFPYAMHFLCWCFGTTPSAIHCRS